MEPDTKKDEVEFADFEFADFSSAAASNTDFANFAAFETETDNFEPFAAFGTTPEMPEATVEQIREDQEQDTFRNVEPVAGENEEHKISTEERVEAVTRDSEEHESFTDAVEERIEPEEHENFSNAPIEHEDKKLHSASDNEAQDETQNSVNISENAVVEEKRLESNFNESSLAAVDSSPDSEELGADEDDELEADEDDKSFANFEPASTSAKADNAPKANEASRGDGDDFAAFESAPVESDDIEGRDEDDFAAFESAPVGNDTEVDEDFGDFATFESSATTGVVHQGSETNDFTDEFAAFETAPAGGVEVQSAVAKESTVVKAPQPSAAHTDVIWIAESDNALDDNTIAEIFGAEPLSNIPCDDTVEKLIDGMIAKDRANWGPLSCSKCRKPLYSFASFCVLCGDSRGLQSGSLLALLKNSTFYAKYGGSSGVNHEDAFSGSSAIVNASNDSVLDGFNVFASSTEDVSSSSALSALANIDFHSQATVPTSSHAAASSGDVTFSSSPSQVDADAVSVSSPAVAAMRTRKDSDADLFRSEKVHAHPSGFDLFSGDSAPLSNDDELFSAHSNAENDAQVPSVQESNSTVPNTESTASFVESQSEAPESSVQHRTSNAVEESMKRTDSDADLFRSEQSAGSRKITGSDLFSSFPVAASPTSMFNEPTAVLTPESFPPPEAPSSNVGVLNDVFFSSADGNGGGLLVPEKADMLLPQKADSFITPTRDESREPVANKNEDEDLTAMLDDLSFMS